MSVNSFEVVRPDLCIAYQDYLQVSWGKLTDVASGLKGSKYYKVKPE